MLWLKPIEAALQRGQGTGGQPAAGTCFRPLPGVKAAKAVSGQMDEYSVLVHLKYVC